MHALVPSDWIPTPETKSEFDRQWLEIRAIVRSCVRLVPVNASYGREDVEAEGAVLALYALDRHRQLYADRPLYRFIHCVVKRGLLSRARSLYRERRFIVASLDGIPGEPRRRAAGALPYEEVKAAMPGPPETGGAPWAWPRHVEYCRRFQTLLERLKPVDRKTLLLVLAPPAELLVLNRNLRGGKPSNQVSRQAIAQYTGRSVHQIHRSFVRCQRTANVMGRGGL